MDMDRSLRQRLQSTVLEAITPAGRAYNAVIFGAILLSVLALLLEPDPLGNSALVKPMCPGSIWFRTFAWRCLRRICSSSGLGGEASPLPVQLHRTD